MRARRVIGRVGAIVFWCAGGACAVLADGNTPAATTISTPVLTNGPAAYGVKLTFSTVVSPAAPGATPTGTVTFMLDSGTTTPQPINSNGTAGISLVFTAGTHSIRAQYSGDGNYLPSSSGALSMTLDKAISVVAMASNPAQLNQPVAIRAIGRLVDPPYGVKALANAYIASTADVPALDKGVAVFGEAVTIRVLVMGVGVSNSFPPPTGTVAFADGGAPLGEPPLVDELGSYWASLTMPARSLSVGTHAISAIYSGDTHYQSSIAGLRGTGTTPLEIVVGKAATALALASTPPQIGQPVTLKAAVTVVAPGNAAPSGTVSFNIGGKAIAGCVNLLVQNGVVTCSASFSQLGDYTIGASYGGDGNTTASSATMQLSVGKAVAGIYTAFTPDAPVFGMPVTINALLLGATGVATPTGTVTFSDGASVRTSVAIGGDGRASLTLSSLGAGSHSFTASYDGDVNYASATATPLNVPVGKASTSTTLTAKSGTVVAAVTVLAPGAGTPTGTVQFLQDGAPVGTAPLAQAGSSFTASLNAASLSGTIWAIYQGDANFSGSASPTLKMTATAKVSITSDHNPATAGQPVTFTVQVAASAGTNVPSGTVRLSADGASLGTAALAGGQVVFSATLAVGSHAITADYSGDPTFAAASASFLQTVGKTTTALSVTANPGNTTVYGQAVTFTATPASGSGSVGTVQFLDGTTVIGSAAAENGVATFTVAGLSPGTHLIAANWAGDDNSAAAVSLPLSQTVNKAQTNTTAAVSGLTLTATIAAVAPGAGVPTGTVTFTDAVSHTVLATAAVTGSGAAAPLTSTANPVVAVYSGDVNFQGSSSSALTPLAAVNAASYSASGFARDEIVTLFGSNLAAASFSDATGLAASLGGTTVAVTDSAGVSRAAGLLFVSPGQASFLVPPDTAPGPATVMVTSTGGAPVSTQISVSGVAPGLFTVDSSGRGTPAGQIVRVHADGTQDAPQSLATFDAAKNQWVATPIDLSAATDTVYLALYGTGLRHASATPVCTIGGQTVAVTFAGAQGGFPGLDQVNVRLPASLLGAKTVDAVVTVDGVSSNTVSLMFQ